MKRSILIEGYMYREIPPVGRLTRFVECFWISQPDAAVCESGETRVVPDGCMDLIFETTPGRENAYWVGTMTTSLCLERSVPRSLLGVRFHPGGARQFLPCPASELVDERVRVCELTPDLFPLLESVVEQRNPLKGLHDWLESRVAPTTPSRMVMEIHCRITSDKKVSEVAEEMGYSRQYLNRVMKDAVGVDLKRFSRILRMRQLVAALSNRNMPVNWSECAVSFGYYDQSHLIAA